MRCLVVRSLLALLAVLGGVAAGAQNDDWERLMRKGNGLDQSGQYQGASTVFQEAVRAAERSGPQNLHAAYALNALGLVEYKLGKFDEAERHYRRALTLLEAGGRKNNRDYALVLSNLSGACLRLGRPAQAEELAREALLLSTEILPPDDPALAVSRNGLVELLLSLGNIGEAEDLCKQVIVAQRNEDRTSRIQYAIGIGYLAVIRKSQKRMEEAIALLEESIKIFEAETGANSPVLIVPLNNLAVDYALTDRTDAASSTFRRAVTIAEESLAPDHPTSAGVRINYASLLRRLGQKTEAAELERGAKAALNRSNRQNGVGATTDLLDLKQRR